MTHICVSNLTNIGSVNGLLPVRRQAITWTNAGILLIGPLGTNFSEILIEIPIFSFKKMRLKEWSAKWRPFCLGLNVLSLVALNYDVKMPLLVWTFLYNWIHHYIQMPSLFANIVICSWFIYTTAKLKINQNTSFPFEPSYLVLTTTRDMRKVVSRTHFRLGIPL